jgi:hypothetical protein
MKTAFEDASAAAVLYEKEVRRLPKALSARALVPSLNFVLE